MAAVFRKNPLGEGWVVVGVPVGTNAGDTVAVAKRDGTVSSVLVAAVAPLPDGTLMATIAPKARKARAAAAPAACPNCGHKF